ncbi:glycosyltransferase [Primorskyibacter aestuariivivens]|uniref:glycosyltransferase n=1 Tax=Primorskyibacter aestuariivivens TaxID=1888912 RepID=UPI0023004124|nr:glycosyltransferase [Primorskyibacter aestuariivivens]MDA7429610.1 glycosyltransferase [Primorskyibacter aestuariivivens]
MSSQNQKDRFVGRYTTYPDRTGNRQAEGGRRLRGKTRSSDAGSPLVSILTVCWNSAATIEQTISSIGKQTYANIEHVVVDGASTDDTLNILRKYEGQIDYFVSEPDTGLYQAMNKALELAQGDYILILNSDDWYVPDCVEALMKAKEETQADFVSGLANYVDGDGKFLRLQPSFSFDGNMFFMMPLRHETMLLSRDIYNRVGPFNLNYKVIADREFTTRLYEIGFTHHEIQRALMNFRDTGVSTVNLDGLRAERCNIIKRNFPFLEETDIERLAFLEQLEPEKLEAMVERYAHPKLSHAAADMVRDRLSRKNKKYAKLDPNKLRQSGIGKSLPLRTPRTQRRLRVATFVTSDHGGAGIGTQRRVAALRAAGVDARIYCLFQNSPYAHVTELTASIPGAEKMERREVHKEWRRRAVVTTDDAKGLRAREFFSKTGTVVDFRQYREIFDEADVIHLHWPVGILDFENLAEVCGDKPVVWTPADMNPYTGGCHYSEGCQKYTKDCQKCPLLNGSQLAHQNWKVKRAAYTKLPDLQIVSPSQWLAERARKSSLWGDLPIHVIPNALPVDRFHPTNKLAARLQLGLPLDKKLILFGADNVTNLRKGGDLMMASIKRLRERGLAKDVEGVVFGANDVEFDIPTHSMGHVAEVERLSLVFAAADVFASPSREDSGPMTVAESMLSGTAVVAFNIGNAHEIVVHKDTGYIAGQEDIEDFTRGLAWALEGAESPDALMRSWRARRAARAHNDPDGAAQRHIALYESMLESPAKTS